MHVMMDRQGRVDFITCAILMVMASVKATKTSQSCFTPQPTQNCSYHHLTCGDGEKVRIDFNRTVFVKKADRLECSDAANTCDSPTYPNCCVLTRGDHDLRDFNTTVREKIKTACLDKTHCVFPAPRMQNLILSVVRYDCIRDDLATTGFKVGVGLAVTVVIIAGICVTLCYLKRQRKQSPQQSRRRLDSALAPLYHEVIDARSFTERTGSYEYATVEEIQGRGQDPKPVMEGYDHLGVVARGVGEHYDTAISAMQQVSQLSEADSHREGRLIYNHLSLKPQKTKVNHNHYDVAMQHTHQ
ncbi:uncharacterized protein LOC124139979 [Haliotis rufescens]|uniref:uncharacterized protein LOC124139979 n=1 Tax=Haliotis rufescens TaxID=6454 RepID=UPI00201F0E0A|nr:uncharacterized protein LOC124139979 [Haliotis rufescens]